MRVRVVVKTQARRESVVQQPDGSLRVAVRVPPAEGKANERVVQLVAAYYGRRPSDVSIVHGHKSKMKLISVEGAAGEGPPSGGGLRTEERTGR
jgi:hypothetical protein